MPSASPILSLPKHQLAIVAQGPGQLALQENRSLPLLEHDMVIVKTAAVAINPADAKMLDYSAAPGAIHGYDFAGTVVALGEDALATGHLAIGDRVAGLVHGMNKLLPDVGAFAQYVGACADLLLKIPDHMSFEEGASFGTGVATASLGLFSELRVPASLDQLRNYRPVNDRPAERKVDDREFVLVAGGSTATGTRAIQLLKLYLALFILLTTLLNHVCTPRARWTRLNYFDANHQRYPLVPAFARSQRAHPQIPNYASALAPRRFSITTVPRALLTSAHTHATNLPTPSIASPRPIQHSYVTPPSAVPVAVTSRSNPSAKLWHKLAP